MSKIKDILATLLLLCFVTIQAVEVVQKLKEYPDGELLFSDYAFKDALLVYAVCEKQVSDKAKTCTIYQQVSPYEGVSRSCNFTIDAKDSELKLADLFVGALNPDKALLVYLVNDKPESPNRLYSGTINLNKCTISVTDILDAGSNKPSIFSQWKNDRTIVLYKNFYDAFSRASFCEDKECKWRINSEGEAIEKSTKAMDGLPFYITQFSSIDSASSDKGYVYRRFNTLDKPSKDYLYAIQKPDLSENKLTTSPANVKYDLLSASNGKVNVYFKATGKDGNMTLLQYDAEGNNVLTTDLPDISKSNQVESIYHLPEGGSILLLADVEDGSVECSKIKSFNIVKIDATGKKLGAFQFDGLDGKSFYDTPIDRYRRFIWKNKQGGYCATIVGPTVKCTGVEASQQNDVQIIENCFTDADFA